MLFRYSAITFNGHRIHYDKPYATEVEGYDGLVVHGPIQASLLYNLAIVSEGRIPTDFTYRGLAPAFADRPIAICRGTGSDAQSLLDRGRGRHDTHGSKDGVLRARGQEQTGRIIMRLQTRLRS